MNEPVAWMSPDGKFSTTEGKLFYIPLYTHPAKENPDSYMFDALNNTLNLERNHNEKAYKELYDLCEKLAKENEALKAKTLTDAEQDACFNRGYKEGARDILNRQAKTLTDEEINELYADYQNPDYYSREVIFDQLGFARAILRKAQEK